MLFKAHLQELHEIGQVHVHFTDEKLRLREIKWLLLVRTEAGGKAKSEPVFDSWAWACFPILNPIIY